MGFRFRKTISLGKGVRLNIGKKSVGVSVGKRGLRVSTNSKGQSRVSAGIPGTGLYWTESLNKLGKGKKKKPPHTGAGCLVVLIVVLLLVVLATL
jgi:hypothetical protein